jgi:chromate transporter
MELGQLFIAFFRVGLFSIGGGYVLIPLIEQEVVGVYGWLSPEEFLEVLGITQGIPGAISMKFATYTGYRLAGYPGVVAANLGILLPPVILMLIFGSVLLRYGQHRVVKAFLKGVQFATIGLLLSVTLNFARGQSWGVAGAMLTIASALLIILTKAHPAAVIFLAGFLGIFFMR